MKKQELSKTPSVNQITTGTGYSAEGGKFSPAEMEAYEVAAYFGTDMENGLTKSQVRNARMKHGHNILRPMYSTSFTESVKKQISGICIPLMIISLLVCAAFIKDAEVYTPIAAVLVAVLLINAAIYRHADSSLNKAMRDHAMRATLLRGGKVFSASGVSLVPGDIIELESGTVIPADARLAEANRLTVLETPVTGIAESTEKAADYISENGERKGSFNMVYAGTVVTSGRGRAIVCRTGNNCLLYRKTGSPVAQLPDMYHRTVKYSGIFTLCTATLSFLLVVAGVLLGRPLVSAYLLAASSALCCMQSSVEVFAFSSFAAGVKRMYKSGAVLRRFSAVDSLCVTDTVMCDKDVAFPMSELRPRRVYIDKSYYEVRPESREDIRKVLTYALLCSDLRRSNATALIGEGFVGKPADVSLARECDRIGINIDDFKDSYFRIEAEYTKSGEIKRALYLHDDANLLVLRGKPEEILPLCVGYAADGINLRFDEQSMRRMQQAAREMGDASQHVIAVASAVCNCDSLRTAPATAYRRLVLNGFIGLYTSLKLDSASAVYKCAAGGIETVMLSQEAYVTATGMAKNAGIIQTEKQVMAAEELKYADRGLYVADSENYKLYLHLNEAQWLDVFRIRKSKNRTVAITAESADRMQMMHESDVSFAPAATAAETVKCAADVLLYKSGLKTVETVIRASKMIYKRITGMASQFATGAAIVLVCALISVLFGTESPLRLQEIVLGGVIFNTVFAAAAAYSPDHRTLLKDPVRYNGGWQGLAFSAVYGAIAGGSLFASRYFLGRLGGSSASNSAVILFAFALVLFCGLLFGAERSHFYRSSAFKSYTVPLSAVLVVLSAVLLVFVPQAAALFGYRTPGYIQYIAGLVPQIALFALIQGALMINELIMQNKSKTRKEKQL